MNILYSLIQTRKQDFIFSEILQRLKPESACAIVYDHPGMEDEYPLTMAHATYTFSRRRCGVCMYDKEPLYEEAPPPGAKAIEIDEPLRGRTLQYDSKNKQL